MKNSISIVAAIIILLIAGSFSGVRIRALADGPATAGHVIKVTAKRFVFQPSSITVKKGERVVLEITSADVPHGFALPDFNVETEVTPGKTSRITFTANKAGDFTFACNVFCGSGHEEMSGTLRVTE